MEAMTIAAEPVNVKPVSRYDRVNGTWPDTMPALTGPEAITAARMLIREGLNYYGLKKLAVKRRTFKLTSGNRYTWPRRGVWYVNPEGHHGHPGWQGLVHFISHWCHRQGYPGRAAHDGTHSIIEKHLIEFVIKRGWLDGRLSEPVKVKPERDVKAERAAGVARELKAWVAKRRRAERRAAR